MPEHPEFCEQKSLIVEAAGALARLDADRLEEMALSCEALNRRPVPAGSSWSEAATPVLNDLRREIAILARVLEATRVNMNVLRRLGRSRLTAIEYGCGQEKDSMVGEIRNGHN
jgi:hypothetical protein